MKSKVDNVDKLIPVPVDLSRLSDVVKIDLFKKNVYNPKIKNTEDKIPDIIILATKSILNAKINEVKEEITKITNLAPTGSYTAVGNKIPSVNNFVKETDYNTKINEVEKKFTDHNHDKHTTTPELNKLRAENFAATLKPAYLACKSDIANFVNKTDFHNEVKNVTQIKRN